MMNLPLLKRGIEGDFVQGIGYKSSLTLLYQRRGFDVMQLLNFVPCLNAPVGIEQSLLLVFRGCLLWDSNGIEFFNSAIDPMMVKYQE